MTSIWESLIGPSRESWRQAQNAWRQARSARQITLDGKCVARLMDRGYLTHEHGAALYRELLARAKAL